MAFAFALRTALDDVGLLLEEGPEVAGTNPQLWAYVDDLTLWARGDPGETAEAVAEATNTKANGRSRARGGTCNETLRTIFLNRW